MKYLSLPQRAYRVATLALAASMPLLAHAQSFTFEDQIIDPANYTVTHHSYGALSSASFGATMNGNPTNAAEYSLAAGPSAGSMLSFIANQASHVIPMGGFDNVRMELDFRMTSGNAAMAFAVRQNGNLYLDGTGLLFSGQWNRRTRASISQNEFNKLLFSSPTTFVDSTSHPDFKLVGSTIDFGFVLFKATAANPSSASGLVDNFRVVTAVPEPSSVGALALGVAGILRARNRRKKRGIA